MPAVAALTETQFEIAVLLAAGFPPEMIAEIMPNRKTGETGIEYSTMSTHIKHLMKVAGLTPRIALVSAMWAHAFDRAMVKGPDNEDGIVDYLNRTEPAGEQE